jgi:hypothetical protein
MATRPTKTITVKPEADDLAQEEPAQELPSQRKLPDVGRFRLQVDRQTKGSYATLEAAEAAGTAIKKKHPIVQVAVYDLTESLNKIIELPKL